MMRASEIHSRIIKAVDGLEGSNGDVKAEIIKAREKIRAYRAMIELARVQLDHAVRTGRLKIGSDVLPDMTMV